MKRKKLVTTILIVITVLVLAYAAFMLWSAWLGGTMGDNLGI